MMATTPVEVNDTTYTLVLDGAGFVYSSEEIDYIFSDTEPSGTGMRINPRNQMRGMTGQKLWAKSVVFTLVDVLVSPEV